MPSATFLNLQHDKRERFIEAALDEFAAHPYDQASISRIVKRIGIAKGSLYQYFSNKHELFTWLVEEAGRRKLELVNTPPPEGTDLFARLAWMYRQGLTFIAREPRWARVALRATEPSQDPEVGRLREQHMLAGQAFLKTLLLEGQQEGSVRDDLDLDLAVPLVHALLSEGLMRAFLTRAGTHDPLDASVTSLSDDDAAASIGAALSLLARGIGRAR